MKRFWCVAIGWLTLLSGAVPALAHEIGTTRVAVHLDADSPTGRTYTVVVVTDADALVEKLEAMADRSGSEPGVGTAARLATLEETFRGRVWVSFDGALVRPTIGFSVVPPSDQLSPAVATIRLSGEVPNHAARFTWTYGWTFASYALRVTETGVVESSREPSGSQEGRDDGEVTQWLEGGEPSAAYTLGTVVPRASWAEVAVQYVWLGFTHIVPKGLDHVLFVVGLFLLSRRWRSLLWQVSAFTIAHSITLGLSMYGLVSLPSSVAEPLIALSIAYVAVENMILSELKAWRVALVFTFGLLHGMGFAGVLTELGLPRGQFATALVGFNIGVEAGQLLVIGAAWAAVGWYRTLPTYRRYVVQPASLAIACVGVYWTIERATSLW
jgi:hypothetical protein